MPTTRQPENKTMLINKGFHAGMEIAVYLLTQSTRLECI